MVLCKLYSNALMSSLNSRAGIYERHTISDSCEGGHASGRFNTAQFTSIGIPATTSEFEWVNRRNRQGAESVRLRPSRDVEMRAG